MGAVVIAAAAAVPLTVLGRGVPQRLATVSPARSAHGPADAAALQPVTPPPPGQRAVTWAGIQFYIPDDWTAASAYGCSYVASVGEVIYPYSGPNNEVFNCPAIPYIRHESLIFGSLAHPMAVLPGVPTTGELAGLSAQLWRMTVDGQNVAVVSVESVGATFTVTTNSQALTDSILASAHRTSADENGCPVDQPGDLKVVAGGGRGGPQVMGSPVAGVICSYGAGRLLSGVSLVPEQLQALVPALNTLPGRYPVGRSPHDAAQPSPDGELASIVLTDANGRTQQITVQSLSQHHAAGVAGLTQSALSAGLFFELVNDLPTAFGGDVPYIQGSLPGPLYGASIPQP